MTIVKPLDYLLIASSLILLISCNDPEPSFMDMIDEHNDSVQYSQQTISDANAPIKDKNLVTPTFDLDQYIGKQANELLENEEYISKITILLGEKNYNKIKRNLKYSQSKVNLVHDPVIGNCIYLTGYDERNEGSLYEGIIITDQSMQKIWSAATTEGAITLQFPKVEGNEDVLPVLYKTWVKDHSMN